MIALLIVPPSEIRSCGVVPSYYIKMMKRRILQVSRLKHSIKKGMFSILGKLNLFKLGHGESSLCTDPKTEMQSQISAIENIETQIYFVTKEIFRL